MNTNCFAPLLAAMSLLLPATAAVAAPPKAGDVAPLFQGKDQDGNDFKLADLVGKKIVLLYFYPKDFTGGCTKEACGFRDRLADLTTNNVAVIGVSFDSADSHKKFAEQYNLNFTLLADPQGTIVDAYDARMFGLKVADRISFLIGLDGKIVHVTKSASPDNHFNEMSAAIARLNKK
jgi:peroxiredoxin Q/BCP